MLMSACSSPQTRLPVKIDASLMQPCPDWIDPVAGDFAIEYVAAVRGEYLKCKERHQGLADAVRAGGG